ncbi:MAG: phosphate uptake regulator PhoU [Sulfolobales archaeon]
MPEIRKVQKFGKSTLMISLPADWVKSSGLKSGDVVGVEVLDDGSLRIASLDAMTKKKEKTVEILLRDEGNEDLLIRSLYGLYLLGYDKIVVRSSEAFLASSYLKCIRNVIRNFIGAEIVEHTPESVTIHILVDPSRYSALVIIERMANIIKLMIQHIVTSIITKQLNILEEVMELEAELDRLYGLAVRQLVLTQNDKNIVKHLGIKASLVTEYRSIVKSLEDIGDSLAQTALILSNISSEVLSNLNLHKDILKECIDTLSLIIDRVIRVLEEPEVYLANSVLNLTNEFDKHLSKYKLIILKSSGLDETYVTVRDVIDKLNIVSKKLEDLAETVFDISIEKSGLEIDLRRTQY